MRHRSFTLLGVIGAVMAVAALAWVPSRWPNPDIRNKGEDDPQDVDDRVGRS